MPRNLTFPILLVFVFAFCLSSNGVYAFGAGNIPSFAYMEGRAFRHGDIEDALEQLIKRGSGGFALASMLSKGSKFNGLDIKRVYFGNWLRDYSQAVDIAALKKMPIQTILNLCMVLGFMAHGYATNEFEVTPERLGVYLPTEHIDNPKGYGDGEDARKYHPKLRGPVDPRELEIDPRTGMKNYIANEQGHWDTSKALVRRTIEQCIHHGRLHRSQGRKQDEYEGFRLLGQAMHTLEDFSAHSNFCEITLVMMGHVNVFTHVGDQVRIQAPNGKWVAPIVTGTFGSNDFIHSLLGEATDHLSEASVSDLNKELDKARSVSQSQSRSGPGSGPSNPGDTLRSLLFSIPGGAGSEMSRDMDSIERIRAGPEQGGKRPEDMSPQELHSVLWQVLSFRDSVVKKISKTIEKIPGLGPLIDKLMDSISVFVFTTLEPFLKPILKSATSGLHDISGEVIDTHDQYEVFNDPRASDPTHSFLSKDHFNLILNEPAGQLARVIFIHAVTGIIKAWDDASVNVHQLIEDILQCLFHPDFHNSNSKIQRDMLQCMHTWVQGLGNKRDSTLNRLTKSCVRNHENIRAKGDGGKPAAQGTFAANEGIQMQNKLHGYASQIPGVSQAQSFLGGGAGTKKDGSGGYTPVNHGHPPPTPGSAASYYGDRGDPASASPAPHAGYAPSYAPSYNSPPPPPQPPAFPGASGPSYSESRSFPGSPPPSFPGGSDQGYGAYHPPSYAPVPNMPGFPGASSGFSPPPGPPPHGSMPSMPGMPGLPPHGPIASMPGLPGGSSGFVPPQGPPPHGFPGADPYGGGPPAMEFPGSSGAHYQPPGSSYPYGGQGGGGW